MLSRKREVPWKEIPWFICTGKDIVPYPLSEFQPDGYFVNINSCRFGIYLTDDPCAPSLGQHNATLFPGFIHGSPHGPDGDPTLAGKGTYGRQILFRLRQLISHMVFNGPSCGIQCQLRMIQNALLCLHMLHKIYNNVQYCLCFFIKGRYIINKQPLAAAGGEGW
jgi:hypothetical protein